MYIMVEDPETGKRLYADLLIREKVFLHSTEIIDIQVMDTCTEKDLAKATAASLKGIETLNTMPLANILKDVFRIFHVPDELLEAIRVWMEEAVPVIE